MSQLGRAATITRGLPEGESSERRVVRARSAGDREAKNYGEIGATRSASHEGPVRKTNHCIAESTLPQRGGPRKIRSNQSPKPSIDPLNVSGALKQVMIPTKCKPARDRIGAVGGRSRGGHSAGCCQKVGRPAR